MNVSIDIVSDLVCPWCFIGKHHLANAIAQVREKHPSASFQLNWLPFFLNPDTPASGEPYRAFLEAKFGGARKVDEAHRSVSDAGQAAGVAFNFGSIVTRPNTLPAHRIIYRAQSIGHRPEEIEALVERLFVGHFQRGEDIGSHAVLADIAAECGDRRDDVMTYLEGSDGEPQVKSLFDRIGKMGVTGVPFFIIQRRLAVSGAQGAAVLAAAIMQAMELQPLDAERH